MSWLFLFFWFIPIISDLRIIKIIITSSLKIHIHCKKFMNERENISEFTHGWKQDAYQFYKKPLSKQSVINAAIYQWVKV